MTCRRAAAAGPAGSNWVNWTNCDSPGQAGAGGQGRGSGAAPGRLRIRVPQGPSSSAARTIYFGNIYWNISPGIDNLSPDHPPFILSLFGYLPSPLCDGDTITRCRSRWVLKAVLVDLCCKGWPRLGHTTEKSRLHESSRLKSVSEVSCGSYYNS